MRQARDFLEEGHKVKVTIVFRGREIAHREIGQKQLQELVQELKDVAVVEQAPRMEGKAMFMLLGAGKGAPKPATGPAVAARPPAPRPPGPPGAPAPVVAQRPTFQAAPASAAPTAAPEGATKP